MRPRPALVCCSALLGGTPSAEPQPDCNQAIGDNREIEELASHAWEIVGWVVLREYDGQKVGQEPLLIAGSAI